VLFVDAASFVATAVLVAIGVPAAASRAEPAAAPGGHSYLAELREGLRFIRAHTVLLSMILIATVGNFLDKPLVTVILPVYAKTFYARQPCLALGAFGAGALTGSLLYAWPRPASASGRQSRRCRWAPRRGRHPHHPDPSPRPRCLASGLGPGARTRDYDPQETGRRR